MTRARGRQTLPRYHVTANKFDDFCLSEGWGIRAGYASTTLLRSLPPATRTRTSGRITLALTANPYYAIHGIRPGGTLRAAATTLHTNIVMRVGSNDWYMAPNGPTTAVLKVRYGII